MADLSSTPDMHVETCTGGHQGLRAFVDSGRGCSSFLLVGVGGLKTGSGLLACVWPGLVSIHQETEACCAGDILIRGFKVRMLAGSSGEGGEIK